MFIFVLKEILDLYNQHKTTIFLSFIDASKAFDWVNHQRLFHKLYNRGVLTYLVRILAYWYGHQLLCVKWGNTVSDGFKVVNGVRQGSILSPYFFNIYMVKLSKVLNCCKTGCVVGECIINRLIYADDLVVLCPFIGSIIWCMHKIICCSESLCALSP